MSDLLPDPREALRLFLNERKPGLPAGVSDLHVGVSIEGAGNCVRLTQAGGVEGWDDGQPLVLVESWGKGANAPDDGSAALVARWVALQVESMRGAYAGGYVAGAAPEGGISDSPDQQTKRPRALLTVRLQTAPLG